MTPNHIDTSLITLLNIKSFTFCVQSPHRSPCPRKHRLWDDRWLSVVELPAYLGTSKNTVYAWVAGIGMPWYKLDRFRKSNCEDVDDWIHDGSATSVLNADPKEKPDYE